MAPDGSLQEQPATRLFLSPPPSAFFPLTPRIKARWIATLSVTERNYLERQSGKRHQEYLLSRALLRQALSLTLSPQTSPLCWQIQSGKQAPPTIEGPHADSWHCAISHSAGRVVVALTNQGPCGVDIELHRPRRNRPELADTFFTAGERALIERTPEPEREIVFYRLWTLKEAWYKSGTQGNFSDILSGLDFSTPAPSPMAQGKLRAWWQEIHGYSLAFAGNQKPVSLTQLLPDEDGMELTNQLREFHAILKAAE